MGWDMETNEKTATTKGTEGNGDAEKIPDSHSRGVNKSHLGSVMEGGLQPRKAQNITETQKCNCRGGVG